MSDLLVCMEGVYEQEEVFKLKSDGGEWSLFGNVYTYTIHKANIAVNEQ